MIAARALRLSTWGVFVFVIAALVANIAFAFAGRDDLTGVTMRLVVGAIDVTLPLALVCFVLMQRGVTEANVVTYRPAAAAPKPPTDAFVDAERRLGALGFVRAGDREGLAKGKVVRSSTEFLAPGNPLVTAAIDHASSRVSFDTYWPSGSLVETICPRFAADANRVFPAGIELQETDAGVEAAYQVHGAAVMRRQAVEGPPYALPDLATVAALDTAANRVMGAHLGDQLRKQAARFSIMALILGVMTWFVFFEMP